MSQLSDIDLMLKVKAGDLQKLGLLYERHKQRLFGFFYQINHDRGLSEDLVQNVFEKILKYRHTFTGKSKFISWMFQIARNASYDQFKKRKPLRYAEDVGSIDSGGDKEEALDYDMIASEDSQTLKLALQRLPFEKREVLVLSKYEELKYREIGEILGCSEAAARTKAHRALTDLKAIFFELEKR